MKISLITAVYNNASGLRSSLFSSFQQSHPLVERIVIDGGSTDGTLKVLEEYATKLDHIVSEPDDGIYDALNKGIQLATGGIVGILHSDDTFADCHTLAKIANSMEERDVQLLYGDLYYVRSENPDEVVRYWKAGEFSPEQLKKGWMPPHPTVYVRRALYGQYGSYNTQYKIAADYDWMLRLFKKNSLSIAYLPEVLVHMCTGGASNRSLRNIWKKTCEDYAILKVHQIGGVSALLHKNFRKLNQFWRRQNKCEFSSVRS